MKTIYLLDTNILSDALKNTRGEAAQKIAEQKIETLCTSLIVAAEMRYGIEKKSTPELTQRVERLLGTIKVLPLEQGVDCHYGRLRARLEKNGQLIGANDMLIAAHAIAIGAVLVTDNVDEFSRIVDLPIENWLIRCKK